MIKLIYKKFFIIRKIKPIVLIPLEESTWDSWYKNIHQFSDDFMTTRNQPFIQQNRDKIF